MAEDKLDIYKIGSHSFIVYLRDFNLMKLCNKGSLDSLINQPSFAVFYCFGIK